MNIIAKYTVAIMIIFGGCITVAILQPDQAIAIVGMGGTICSVLITGLVQAIAHEETVRKTSMVAEKLEQNDAKTEKTLEQLSKVTIDTHVLVNSAMGKQLHLGAELARWKANQTKNDIDEKAALEAERLLMEHITKQNTVDTEEAK